MKPKLPGEITQELLEVLKENRRKRGLTSSDVVVKANLFFKSLGMEQCFTRQDWQMLESQGVGLYIVPFIGFLEEEGLLNVKDCILRLRDRPEQEGNGSGPDKEERKEGETPKLDGIQSKQPNN